MGRDHLGSSLAVCEQLDQRAQNSNKLPGVQMSDPHMGRPKMSLRHVWQLRRSGQ